MASIALSCNYTHCDCKRFPGNHLLFSFSVFQAVAFLGSFLRLTKMISRLVKEKLTGSGLHSFILNIKSISLNNLTHDIDGNQHGSELIAQTIISYIFIIGPMFKPEKGAGLRDLLKQIQVNTSIDCLNKVCQYIKSMEKSLGFRMIFSCQANLDCIDFCTVKTPSQVPDSRNLLSGTCQNILTFDVAVLTLLINSVSFYVSCIYLLAGHGASGG